MRNIKIYGLEIQKLEKTKNWKKKEKKKKWTFQKNKE